MFFLFTFCDCHWLIVWSLPFFLGWIFGMRLTGSYKSRISELENNRLKNSNKIIALEEDINLSHSKLISSKEDAEKSRQHITQIEAELALAKGSLYEVEEAKQIKSQAAAQKGTSMLKSTAASATTAVGLGSMTDSILKESDTSSGSDSTSSDIKPQESSGEKIIDTITEEKISETTSDKLADSSDNQLPEVKSFKELQQEKAQVEVDQTLADTNIDSNVNAPKDQSQIANTTDPSETLEVKDESVLNDVTDLEAAEKKDSSGGPLDSGVVVDKSSQTSSSETTESQAIKETPTTKKTTDFSDSLGIASAAAVVGSVPKDDSQKNKRASEKSTNKKKSKAEKKKKKSSKKKSTTSKSKKKSKTIDSGFKQASSGRFKKTEENDLSIIEGIGPKTAELLQKNGITSWGALASKTPSELKDLLSRAGSRFSHLDPSTWTRQANLAAGNHWTRLEKLQDSLDGGKVKADSKSGKKASKSQNESTSKKGKRKVKSSKKASKTKKSKQTSVRRASQTIVVGSAVKTSNLEVIEGIGPKMNSILNKEGIKSWKDLSSYSPGEIRSLLDKYGDRYRIVDVKQWPKQASYAAKGQWSKLIDFQKSDGSASKAEKVLTKAGVFKSNKVDDLKLIEGIGPKTEKVLNKAGIKNWKSLSKTSSAKLTEIMSKAGKRFAFADTSTWSKQADLAASGKFNELEKLQQKL